MQAQHDAVAGADAGAGRPRRASSSTPQDDWPRPTPTGCRPAGRPRGRRACRRRSRRPGGGSARPPCSRPWSSQADGVAQRAHAAHGVADQDHGAAARAQVGEALLALALEGRVADRQHLVDQQDVGVDVDGHREAQPHVHAGGVVLHRLVDELLDPAEVDDLVEAPVELATGQAQDRAVEVDVLPAGQLGVEAAAELEQRRQPAAACAPAPRSGSRILARHLSSVDLPEPFSPMSPKVEPSGTSNVTSSQRPEVLVGGPAAAAAGSP